MNCGAGIEILILTAFVTVNKAGIYLPYASLYIRCIR